MPRTPIIGFQAGGSHARIYTWREPALSMWRLSPEQATAWREAIAPFELQQLTGEIPTATSLAQAGRIMEAVMPGEVRAHYYGKQVWPPASPASPDWGALIAASGLSLKLIAQQLGVSYQLVQWWKSGRQGVPEVYATNLAAILAGADEG